MEHGILSNLQLLGDRVVIKVDQIQDHSITESGIIVPSAELAETDGGKIQTRPTSEKRLSKGTILAISTKASEETKLEVNDKVYFAKSGLSGSFDFDLDRNALSSSPLVDKSVICIPSTLIEAKII